MRWFRTHRNDKLRRAKAAQRTLRLGFEQLEGRRMLAATNILTYLGDLAGTGANTNETTLTPANVLAATFGKVFTSSVDGQVYAQPLFMDNVNITTGTNQGVHNVVFVATAHDSLYAFDANNGALLWHTSFINNTAPGVLDVNPNINASTVVTTVPSADVNSTDISPEIGVIDTPVIDPTTNALYLTAKTKDVINGKTTAPDYVYQLYAINISNGRLQTSIGGGVMQFGDTVYSGGNYTNTTPIADAATTTSAAGQVGGIIKFNSLREMDRTGLTLFNGQIYIGFASHGDNGPYHGWVLAFNASNLQLSGVFDATPGNTDGGIWQSGGKIEVDPATGALFFETGNGGFDSTLNAQGFPVNGDYGDSVIKLVVDPTTTAAHPGQNGWGLKVADYFAPFNQGNLNSDDTDLAASGLVLLPDSAGTAAHPHLLIARGKSGEVYLIDRDNMGKFSPSTDHVLQEYHDPGGYWSSPTYFDGSFYGTPSGGNLHQWSVSNASFSTSVVHSSPDTFGFPGATGFISANGTSNGIIWEVDHSTNTLRAYNAANVGSELYTSAVAAGGRDTLGASVKFSVPIVDNGRVYVGTGNSLVVYGLLNPPTTAPAAPTNLAATALSAAQVLLTWARNSTNESGFFIERSTDDVNFVQVGLADAGTATFIDANALQPHTTYYYRIRAFNSIGDSGYSNVTPTTTLFGVVGVWADRDVGTPNATGGASFADNTFTVSGSGNIISNTSDNFHYVYQPLTGDGTIIAQVLTEGNTDPAAKAGVMIRETLAANSAFADVVTTPGSGVLFQDRTATGGSTVAGGSISGAAPEWVMLVRSGNVITGYASSDGVNYTRIGSATFSMAQTVFIGLAVASDNDGTLSTATFNNVQVLPPETYLSDLSWVSATNGTGAVQKDKSAGGATINLGGTPYSKGLGVVANSDVVYNLSGNYTTFISDVGIDSEVGNSGTADFQVFGDGHLLYDSGPLTGGGAIDHLVVNVTGVNSLDLRVTDGSGAAGDHADWAGARLGNELPAAPSNLVGQIASGSQINLSWTDNSLNENAFEILREDPNTSTFNLIGSVAANVTSYVDAGLQNGQTYSYQVQAANTVGNSAVSNTATIPIPAPPADPTDLQVTQVTTTSISLTWTIPPTNDIGVNVYRRDTTTSAFPLIASLPANTTSYTDTGLTPGTEHEYSVQTFNVGGFSGPANLQTAVLTVAPTNLTVVASVGQVQLSWAVPAGAATFNVYRSTSPGTEGTTSYATGLTTNSFQDLNVATGTTYFYTVTAVDDGGESAQSTETHATVSASPPLAPGPFSIWSTATTPGWIDNPDPNAVELGVKFRSDSNGFISGLRFYKSTNNTGTHVADLWTAGGTLLATATFTNATAAGWQTVLFAQPVAITANTVYIASYHTNTGNYSDDIGFFATAGVNNGPLHALANGVSGADGVYTYGAAGSFPTSTYNSSNYYVDVVLTSLVNSVTPAASATNVAINSAINVRFNAAMNPATLTSSTLLLKDGSGNIVATTITYNSSSQIATLTPNASLVQGVTYSVVVVGGAGGVADQNGDTLASNFTSTFTTVAPPTPLAPGPFSLWSLTTVPSVVDNPDPNAVELGVKFRSDGDGFITGIRFYKSGNNTSVHVGNLWSDNGTLLATATFTNETASGWQTVLFSQPVAILANTTYIASYHTNTGNYADTIGQFTSAGVNNGPLHALANGVDGPNGVYNYGAASAFPSNTYKGSNYWVDVIMTSLVGSVTPAAGATGVPANAAITVQFNAAMNAATLTSSSLLLEDPSNNVVATTIAYNSTTNVATLTPAAPLNSNVRYTVVVKGGAAGVKDAIGDSMASDFSSTFTTAVQPANTNTGPLSIWSNSTTPTWLDNPDTNAVELGMKFQSDLAGTISGIRFYKSANNTGPHTVSLWSDNGTLLATATATNETASGWQTVTFAAPVAIQADTTYIASYHTSVGNYSDDIGFFATAGVTTGPLHALADGTDGPDGVYHYGAGGVVPSDTYHASNYWVDVLFTPNP